MKKVLTVQYRGFEITVRAYPSQFGTVYMAKNNYGEPYNSLVGQSSPEAAIEWDKKNLDQLLDE